jgi:hypothetical protein
MQIHRAQSLGLLAKQLDIEPNARISYNLTNSGALIWDLSTGKKYNVTEGTSLWICSSFRQR